MDTKTENPTEKELLDSTVGDACELLGGAAGFRGGIE